MDGILRLTYPDVELGETLRCADIRPQAAIVFAADFAERDLRTQQRGERRNAAARNAGEQRGLVDADAAESQRGHAPLSRQRERGRSEERRVGKERRSRWSPYH